MIRIEECLEADTPITIVTDRVKKKGIFRRVEKPREYFVKNFNPAEFIGEELCLIKNIRVNHYFLACLSTYNIGSTYWYRDIEDTYPLLKIASKNFQREGYIYKTITDYGFNQHDDVFEEMLTVAKDDKNREELCNDMLNKLALEIFMGQTDAYAFNYKFEEDKEHNVRLAPLYDFQYSVNPLYIGDNEICFGDLHHFKTIDDVKEFIKKYPKFREMLESYLKEDLAGIVKMAYGKRHLHVPERKLELYNEFGEKRKQLIKTILK